MKNQVVGEATPQERKITARAQFGDTEYKANNLKYAKENADRAIRLNYNEVSDKNKELIEDFKRAIASLHVEMSLVESEVDWKNRETIDEAKKHLQLASYYIVHALTSK